MATIDIDIEVRRDMVTLDRIDRLMAKARELKLQADKEIAAEDAERNRRKKI